MRVLVERAGFRLRHLGLRAATVNIKLRHADFSTLTRARTLPEPTSLDEALYAMASTLLREHWNGRPLRLIGVSLSGLSPEPDQAGLFEDHSARALQQGLDKLREKYGRRAVTTADAVKAGTDRSASAGPGLRHGREAGKEEKK
jgi:DNA polymerase-4